MAVCAENLSSGVVAVKSAKDGVLAAKVFRKLTSESFRRGSKSRLNGAVPASVTKFRSAAPYPHPDVSWVRLGSPRRFRSFPLCPRKRTLDAVSKAAFIEEHVNHVGHTQQWRERHYGETGCADHCRCASGPRCRSPSAVLHRTRRRRWFLRDI